MQLSATSLYGWRMWENLQNADVPVCLTPKCTFICVYWWTRKRINSTLIVVDRYLRLMGDKTIPDEVPSSVESFYLPFIADIDLPHQGVVDSYNRQQRCPSLLTHKVVKRPRWFKFTSPVRKLRDGFHIYQNNTFNIYIIYMAITTG